MRGGRPEQDKRTGDGRYDAGSHCYACDKPAGDHYFSHGLTDSTGSDGERWGDIALVLCARCASATNHMTTVDQFVEYRAEHHPAYHRKGAQGKPVTVTGGKDTHAVQLDSAGRYARVLCGWVRLDRLGGVVDLTSAPTCLDCQEKLKRGVGTPRT